jgi:hypothetical protein
MYNNTDHTGSYATIRGRNNTSSVYYAFIHGFNFGDVPADAIVNSFSVKIKAYRSSNLSTSNLPKLTSAPSNNNIIANTTLSSGFTTDTAGAVYTFPNGSLTWSQLVGYGTGFSIEITLLSTSNQYPYAYVYGAEIEVDYTLPTPRQITVSNTSTATVDPSGTQTVYDGDDFMLTLTNVSNVNNIKVTDNGNDVTSSLVLIPSGTTSKTFNPSALEDHLGYNGASVTNPENACTNTGSTNYAELLLGGGTVAYMLYAFDTTQILNNATINSVSCSAKISVSSTSTSITNKSVQLYAGSTAKGTAYTNVTTSTTPFNITAGSNWTVNDVHNIKIRATATYSRTNGYTLRIYGVNLTINYTVNDISYSYTISNISADHTIVISNASTNKLHVRTSSGWVEAVKVHKKINGSWIEQTDLSNLFSGNTLYVCG